MFEESAGAYRPGIEAMISQGETDAVALRGAVFRRVIPRIYRYTCAVTGWSVASHRNAAMIDACHIVPFAESRDDTIGNGTPASTGPSTVC